MIKIEELAGESPDYGVFVHVDACGFVNITQTTGRPLPVAVNGDSRILADRVLERFDLIDAAHSGISVEETDR